MKIWVLHAMEDPGEASSTFCGFTDETLARKIAAAMEEHIRNNPPPGIPDFVKRPWSQEDLDEFQRLDKEWCSKLPIAPYVEKGMLGSPYNFAQYDKWEVWEMPVHVGGPKTEGDDDTETKAP